MDNQALQKIRDTFAASGQIALIVGKNPSVDQMASALALYLTMISKGKKATVVSPTEPIVELSSLVGIDKVKTGMEGSSGDLVVSFPYREGEIEKVSYTIEGDALNIVVKAGEAGLTFSEQDVLFKRGADKPDLIVAVGVAHLSGISDILAPELMQDVEVINIDNSNQNEGYGSMVLVSPKFSSLSEQVADLLLNLEFDIDVDTAQNLMLGLIAGTNNFQNAGTSYLAFEIAGILMKRGAVRTNVNAQQVSPVQAAPQQAPRQQQNAPRLQQQPQLHSQPSSQQQPQSQPRDDRREAIRDALRAQAQTRNEQRPVQPRNDRPQAQNQQGQPVQNQPLRQQQSEQKPPSDWLTPKVYKGSSSV